MSTDVLVIGAGPTGLALACELGLAGVRCRVLERRATAPNITRAFAVHARTLDLLDSRGLADDVVARGIPVCEIAPAPGATVDLRTLESRFPMILIAPQSATEHVLERRARALGVDVVRDAEVVGLRQDDDGVEVELRGGHVERAGYVVGTDGAHSTVRRLLGVDFVGTRYETHIMLADVRLSTPPEEAMFATTSERGAVLVVPFGDGWFRVIAWDRLREQVPLDVPLPMDEMRDAVVRIAGTDLGLREQRRGRVGASLTSPSPAAGSTSCCGTGGSCWSIGRTRACRSSPRRSGSCAVRATTGPGWCSSVPTATSPGPLTGRTSQGRARPSRAGARAVSAGTPRTSPT